MAIQHVVGDSAALTTILRQVPAVWPRSQRLLAHQAFDAEQAAWMASGQKIVPDTASAIRAVAADEALAYLAAKIVVTLFPELS